MVFLFDAFFKKKRWQDTKAKKLRCNLAICGKFYWGARPDMLNWFFNSCAKKKAFEHKRMSDAQEWMRFLKKALILRGLLLHLSSRWKNAKHCVLLSCAPHVAVFEGLTGSIIEVRRTRPKNKPASGILASHARVQTTGEATGTWSSRLCLCLRQAQTRMLSLVTPIGVDSGRQPVKTRQNQWTPIGVTTTRNRHRTQEPKQINSLVFHIRKFFVKNE